MKDEVVRAKSDMFWGIEQIVNDRDKFLGAAMPLSQKMFFINYYRHWIDFPNHYFFMRFIDDVPMSFRLFVIIPSRPNECCIGVTWNKKNELKERRDLLVSKLATLDHGLDQMKLLNVDTFYRTHPVKNWKHVAPGRLADPTLFSTEDVELIKGGTKPSDPEIATWQYYDHTTPIDQMLVKHVDLNPSIPPQPKQLSKKELKRLANIAPPIPVKPNVQT
jgi:hypothetical protein